MPEDKDAPEPVGYQSIDPKGSWFRLNSLFDMEDPTNAWKAGGAARLPRFVAGSYTQSTDTAWTEAQWRAGVLTKFSGRPGDKDVKEIPYVAPVVVPAAEVAKDAAQQQVKK